MGNFRPPFTVDAFMEVFARYNNAIWPLHIIVYLLGIAIIVASIRSFRGSHRMISGLLAFLWVWVGAVYHLIYFRAINPAALLFGILFILQGGIFLVLGVVQERLIFRAQRNSFGVVGGLFILYATAIYPALGYVFGHVYPHAPVFGVAPCPLLIFTFGVLLFTTQRPPACLFIIPTLWAVVGLSAATALRVPQDFALIISAVATIVMLTIKHRRDRRTTAPRLTDALH